MATQRGTSTSVAQATGNYDTIMVSTFRHIMCPFVWPPPGFHVMRASCMHSEIIFSAQQNIKTIIHVIDLAPPKHVILVVFSARNDGQLTQRTNLSLMACDKSGSSIYITCI